MVDKRMTQGNDIPLELLPIILEKLQWRTKDLASCALVNKVWHTYANPFLYARLFLRDQTRLIRVFRTLKENARLAILVHVLEIRVFPFGLQAESLEALEESILHTLQKAINLQELYWTRTGSLTDRVIPFLPSLPRLHTLELTGSSRFYTPSSIGKHLLDPTQTPNLKHFSVLLPDRGVVAELPQWCQRMGAKLESFSILCQHSALITDAILIEASQHLIGLKRLSLAGCKALMMPGILALLKNSRYGIEDLAIEGLAMPPNCLPDIANHLSQLHSLSLTFPRPAHSITNFWLHLNDMMESLPKIENFTLYTSSWNTPRGMYTDTLDSDEENGENDEEIHQDHLVRQQQNGNGFGIRRFTGNTSQEYRRHELEEHARSGKPIVREPKVDSWFLKRFLPLRGKQLSKLRIHGIVMTIDQVREISIGCPNLKDLVVHLYEGDKDILQNALASLTNLKSLHILSSMYSEVYLSEDNLREIAAHCSTELRQIGFRNRIWLIDRIPDSSLTQAQIDSQEVNVRTDDGRLVFFRRWDMSAGTFPEVLLVVRACECQFDSNVVIRLQSTNALVSCFRNLHSPQLNTYKSR